MFVFCEYLSKCETLPIKAECLASKSGKKLFTHSVSLILTHTFTNLIMSFKLFSLSFLPRKVRRENSNEMWNSRENEENHPSCCHLILWFVKFVNECKARNDIEITERIFPVRSVKIESKFFYNCTINSLNEKHLLL